METPDDSQPSPVSEEPRDFPDSDLDFIAGYKGYSDYPKLRDHVIAFWREVKSKVGG